MAAFKVKYREETKRATEAEHMKNEVMTALEAQKATSERLAATLESRYGATLWLIEGCEGGFVRVKGDDEGESEGEGEHWSFGRHLPIACLRTAEYNNTLERLKAEHKAEITTLTSQIEALNSQLRSERSEFQAKLRETELALSKSAQVFPSLLSPLPSLISSPAIISSHPLTSG